MPDLGNYIKSYEKFGKDLNVENYVGEKKRKDLNVEKYVGESKRKDKEKRHNYIEVR